MYTRKSVFALLSAAVQLPTILPCEPSIGSYLGFQMLSINKTKQVPGIYVYVHIYVYKWHFSHLGRPVTEKR